jgi:hypothetical protein
MGAGVSVVILTVHHTIQPKLYPSCLSVNALLFADLKIIKIYFRLIALILKRYQ